MPSLPSELWDLIFEQLLDDRPCLALCSTVCKEWLSRSRYHRFHSVLLDHNNHQAFAALLAFPGSSLAAYVQVLILSNNSPSHSVAWLNSCAHWLPLLSQVATLHLTRFDLDASPLSQSVLATVADSCRKISRLLLTSLSFGPFSQFATFASSFPALRILEIQNVAWLPDGLPNGVSLPPQLDLLSLGTCYKRDVLRWFLSLNPITKTRSIVLSPVGPADTPAIANYLRAQGAHLKRMRLSFRSMDSGGDAEDFSTSVLLSDTPSLEEIRIDELINGCEFSLSSPVPWVIRTLDTVYPGSLKSLILSFIIDSVRDLHLDEEQIYLDALDYLLSQPKFSELQRLELHIVTHFHPTDQALAPILRSKFPQLEKKGLLKIYISEAGTR